MHGRTLQPTFDDACAPAQRPVQYFEQMGHRGIWADGWKATTYHEAGHPYDDEEWELFHLDDDFSECHNLAPEQPEKLREMIDLWWSQAGEMGVLPLDDRTIELGIRIDARHTVRRKDAFGGKIAAWRVVLVQGVDGHASH